MDPPYLNIQVNSTIMFTTKFNFQEIQDHHPLLFISFYFFASFSFFVLMPIVALLIIK